jgi:hypothetical protein
MKFLLVIFMVIFPLFVTHETGVILFLPFFGVASGTVIHFHAISVRFVQIKAGNILPPDVDGCNPSAGFPHTGGNFSLLGKIPMACGACHFSHFHMGDVRKVDTVGLL